MAHYLDSSLDSWLRYVADKRKEFEELNMFTMDQLVFLQEQLVLLEFDDVSPDIFPLISLLQPDCSEDALQTAKEEGQCIFLCVFVCMWIAVTCFTLI